MKIRVSMPEVSVVVDFEESKAPVAVKWNENKRTYETIK